MARFLMLVALSLGLVGCGVNDAESQPSAESQAIAVPSSGTGQAEPSVTLFPARISGKWGFIDKTGVIVVQPQFRWAGDFAYGLAPVAIGDDLPEEGYVDSSGKAVIGAVLDAALQFSEGLGLVANHDGWGFMDTTGRYVIPPQYDDAHGFSEGLAAVKTKKGWGFIDQSGKFVIEPQYADAGDFGDGLAPVGEKDGWEFIDNQGRVVIPPQPSWHPDAFTEGLAPVWVPVDGPSGGLYGYIDKTGQFVLPAKWGRALHFSGGLAPARAEDDPTTGELGKWGFIDISGHWVVEPQFYGLGEIHGGLAYTETADGKMGYVDATGKVIWSEP